MISFIFWLLWLAGWALIIDGMIRAFKGGLRHKEHSHYKTSIYTGKLKNMK